MLIVHPSGTVIVWLPLDPPLKLKPPCALLSAAVTVIATVLAVALYDMNWLTLVSPGATMVRGCARDAGADPA